MKRFVLHAIPLLVLLLALFGFTVELLEVEPRRGSVFRLALFEQPGVPELVVLGVWLIEASALVALFLLAQGRCGAWWLDGLVAGWIAWTFRGPLLVITIVFAVRQPQEPWWSMAIGWWVLYSVCGLSLAFLYRRAMASAKDEQLAAAGTQDLPAPAIATLEAPAAGSDEAEESGSSTADPAEVEPGGAVSAEDELRPAEEDPASAGVHAEDAGADGVAGPPPDEPAEATAGVREGR